MLCMTNTYCYIKDYDNLGNYLAQFSKYCIQKHQSLEKNFHLTKTIYSHFHHIYKSRQFYTSSNSQ